MTAENGSIDYEYWEKRLGVNRNDPNFRWYIEQASANEIRGVQAVVVPVGKSLNLPKLKDVKMSFGGAPDD